MKVTEMARVILEDRYTMKDETIEEMFSRVAHAYADNEAHAIRLLSYMEKFWFMPATPILSNGGTDRGLPISCFVNEVDDSLQSIAGTLTENFWLSAKGGGIGTYWGNVRSVGENIKAEGKTSGIIPFICIQNATTLAVSQGSLRRGSSSVYLPVWHPEIEEFIDIRKPTGGDYSRKALNIHHAVVITDDFMEAVEKNAGWKLTSPVDGSVVSVISARNLWIKILTTRIETGEPYILFRDNADRYRSEVYKKAGLHVTTSNLCNEIMLHTGTDNIGGIRTAVCCLASVNLEYFDEWSKNIDFIEDIMRFLDNVLQYFIENAPDVMRNAKYSAYRERSVGLGAMGFHASLQKHNVPFDSHEAILRNEMYFSHIARHADRASKKLAVQKGACPDAIDAGLMERFSNKTAIAPTASISIIAGNTSPGIDPYIANAYTHKTLSGSFLVKNKYLELLLQTKCKNTPEVWTSIITNNGSVQHLDFLTKSEKAVYRTAFEIPQMSIVSLGADRNEYICQGQSLNIYLSADTSKKDLHYIHFEGWKMNLKGFYYCRSQSVQKTEVVTNLAELSEQFACASNCGSCQ